MNYWSKLLLGLTLGASLVGCSRPSATGATSASAAPVASTRATAAPWSGCMLPEAPPGACGEAWGRSDSMCDPDRFLNRAAFAFAPDEAPPGFPLSAGSGGPISLCVCCPESIEEP